MPAKLVELHHGSEKFLFRSGGSLLQLITSIFDYIRKIGRLLIYLVT